MRAVIKRCADVVGSWILLANRVEAGFLSCAELATCEAHPVWIIEAMRRCSQSANVGRAAFDGMRVAVPNAGPGSEGGGDAAMTREFAHMSEATFGQLGRDEPQVTESLCKQLRDAPLQAVARHAAIMSEALEAYQPGDDCASDRCLPCT